jgi:hypothetical protein
MDSRYLAANTNRWYIGIDEKRMMVTVEIETDDGDEEIEVPFEWEVCPTCNGKGTHVDPDIDSHGISSDEFADDPDFEKAYFKGRYDVSCYECNSKRVIPVTKDERVLEHIKNEQNYAYESMQERKMGY